MTKRNPCRIGILRLTDAAPLVIAREAGYFAAEGIDVELSVEPSWANIADKLVYGLIEGAMMLPPLALALSLGLRGGDGLEALVVPASLSLDGNTVTLAERWAGPVLDEPPGEGAALTALETARRFARLLRQQRERPRLAVVHTFSTHNLLLRYWLAAGGIDPDRGVSLAVVPPAQTVAAMSAGQIDGFCAGAPWGEIAARAGLGRAVATSHMIWNHGPEKVFAMRRAIAERHPDRVQAVLRALLRAAAYCDAPEHAGAVAAILSQDCYLALPAEVILTSLPGAGLPTAPLPANADRCVFFANAATFPWRSHAEWFLREMVRWGFVGAAAHPKAASALYRPDLYSQAARSLGLSVPTADRKSEGYHAEPWLLPALPAPVPMGADRFGDGARFDPGGSGEPSRRCL